jgi:hypothetical protein
MDRRVTIVIVVVRLLDCSIQALFIVSSCPARVVERACRTSDSRDRILRRHPLQRQLQTTYIRISLGRSAER